MPSPILARGAEYLRVLWPAAVAALGLVPGALLIWAVWQVDADGFSPVAAKWPSWDFTNLWAGGVLAASGRLDTLFDPAAYSQWLRSVLSPRVEDSEWSYPPTMLLLGLPLARLPLIPSYLAWTFGTLLLFWAAMRRGGLGLAACAAALVSPAVLNNAALGQNGALTASLLVGAL
ncbi:MAG: glycosyltransferase 87 family protein, partial [Rhodospirillales bacterium]